MVKPGRAEHVYDGQDLRLRLYQLQQSCCQLLLSQRMSAMQPEHNSSRSVAAEIDSSHSSAIAMDSAVAAHALADAAAQVLVDDKDVQYEYDYDLEEIPIPRSRVHRAQG